MIQDIMKDEAFLSQKSTPAAPDDLPVAQDLLDTLTAHKDGCVGMAANMIGVQKKIIAPAKKMVVDSDSFSVEGLPQFLEQTEQPI